MVTTKYCVGKHACYALLGILLAVLQNTPGFLVVFDTKSLLVFALAIAVAVTEKETVGSLFGIFFGVLCDLFSSYTFGFYSLALFIACMFVGILSKGYIRPIITNCFIFTLLLMILVQWVGFFFSILIWESGNLYGFFISNYVTLSVYTAITSLPIFYVVQKIHFWFQKRINMA